MKLAVALAFALGYCTLLVVGTEGQKNSNTKGKASTPARTPTPAASPRPTTTPAARVSPTPTPRPTPTPAAPVSPTPGPVASPTTTPTPTTTTPGQVGGGMKILPFSGCEGVTVLPGIPLCSKTQPGDLVLCADCPKTGTKRDPEGLIGPSRFTHVQHATKNYSVDGKSKIGCVECHHTDAPAAALKPPYKTSQRNVMLEAATLNDANAGPVYACRACHTPVGMKPKLLEALPPVSEPESPDPLVTSKVAYHFNCIPCHQNANTFPGRTPVSRAPDECSSCHQR